MKNKNNDFIYTTKYINPTIRKHPSEFEDIISSPIIITIEEFEKKYGDSVRTQKEIKQSKRTK